MRRVAPVSGDYVVRLCPPLAARIAHEPIAICCVTRHPELVAISADVDQLPRPFARGVAYERAKAAGTFAWDDSGGRMESID